MAIITVSKETFSGGRKLAECIALKLGYPCISREVLIEASRLYGVPEEILLRALTQKPGFLKRLTLERAHCLAYIRAALMREVRDERVVYHGHAGHLLMRGVPHVLRIKVIADMEFRVATAMEREHLSQEEAVQFIRRMDGDRVRWTKLLYGVDWKDPSLYDIVVNSDNVGLECAADNVAHLVTMDGYHSNTRSQRTISDLILSTHLRALIAADRSISDGDIEITSDGGVVSIAGTVNAIWEADKVRILAGNIPGVVGLVSKLRARLPVWPIGAS